MGNEQTYRLTEKDLLYMINEAVGRIISEGNDLAVEMAKYEDLYIQQVYSTVSNICNEMSTRCGLLKKNNLMVPIGRSISKTPDINKEQITASQGTTAVNRPNLYGGQSVNENISGGLLKVGKELGKMGLWYGIYAGLDKASSFIQNSGLLEKMKSCVQKIRNKEVINSTNLVEAYQIATVILLGVCNDIKNYPQLIGTNSNNINQNIFNGPQQPSPTAYEVTTEKVIPGISFAMAFIPEVGVLGSFLVDVANEAIKLIGSSSHNERYNMRVIEKQYEYIAKTTGELTKVLTVTKNNQFLNNAKQMLEVWKTKDMTILPTSLPTPGYRQDSYSTPTGYAGVR